MPAEYHRYYIRSARASAVFESYRRSYCGNYSGKSKLKHFLIRKRRGHRHCPFKHLYGSGKKQTAIYRFPTEVFSHKGKAEYHKYNVEYEDKVCRTYSFYKIT